METFIYIIYDGQNVKIGKSNHPKKRIKELQTANPKNLKIIKTFSVPGNKVFTIEKECHKNLNKIYEKRGEWFSDVDLWDVEVIVESTIESHMTLLIPLSS